jgi:hypothetical protein
MPSKRRWAKAPQAWWMGNRLERYLPPSTFRRFVIEHRGEQKGKDFSCLNQFFAMVFAEFTYREPCDVTCEASEVC